MIYRTQNLKQKTQETSVAPMKHCSRCNKSYPATSEYFRRNKNYVGGLNFYCILCDRELGKVYMKKYLDRRRMEMIEAKIVTLQAELAKLRSQQADGEQTMKPPNSETNPVSLEQISN
jgi:hypothetical protein